MKIDRPTRFGMNPILRTKHCTTSEDLIPSVHLGTGGFMFELFILRFGIARHREALEDGPVSSRDNQTLRHVVVVRSDFKNHTSKATL